MKTTETGTNGKEYPLSVLSLWENSPGFFKSAKVDAKMIEHFKAIIAECEPLIISGKQDDCGYFITKCIDESKRKNPKSPNAKTEYVNAAEVAKYKASRSAVVDI